MHQEQFEIIALDDGPSVEIPLDWLRDPKEVAAAEKNRKAEPGRSESKQSDPGRSDARDRGGRRARRRGGRGDREAGE